MPKLSGTIIRCRDHVSGGQVAAAVEKLLTTSIQYYVTKRCGEFCRLSALWDPKRKKFVDRRYPTVFTKQQLLKELRSEIESMRSEKTGRLIGRVAVR